MERKQSESINQWRRRVRAQKKEDSIQKEIERVKNQEDYGGELNPAVVIYDQNQPVIKQGYQQLGSKNNNHKVGQDSVFGEREYHPNRSLAERAWNSFTDAVHLTSPPTSKDGYGRTLNAEVPLMESAQGQELKRMYNTGKDVVKIASIPFLGRQLYYNPLATSAAVGTGAAFDWGVGKGIDFLDKQLNKTGKKFSEDQKNTVRFLAGLTTGSGAYKWGDAATKRGLEVAMHTTGAANPMRQIQDGWATRNWKQRGDVINYILTGKNKNGTSNTLGYLENGVPTFYTGLNSSGNKAGVPEYGKDAVRTYLYGEPLVDFKPVSGNPLGAHADYVLKNYPNKRIAVYEANQPYLHNRFRPSVDPTPIKVEGQTGDIRNFGTTRSYFDAAGHLKETGILDGDLFTRQQDIWKFNSKDYMDRWLGNNSGKGILGKLPLKWGLDIVDYHGNPFIVRSPWVSERTIDPPQMSVTPPSMKKLNMPDGTASDYDIDWYDGIDLEPPIYSEPEGPPMTDNEKELFMKILKKAVVTDELPDDD